MATPNTGIRAVSLVAVPTVKQDEAIAFYESLGFEKRVDNTFGPNYRWVEVYPPEGPVGLAISPPPGGEVTPYNTGVILTTNNIDATHAAFLELGIDADAQIMRMNDGPVPPMFFFRDPSGHTLLVVEES